MAKATFYIEIDTYWQNSKSSFVGPFESREAAMAWHQQDMGDDANVWYSTSTCGGDIRDAYRIYPEPLSKTAARRRGLRRFGDRDEMDNEISPVVQPTAHALAAARQRAMEMMY